MGLRTAFMNHKGPRVNAIVPLLSKSPQLFTKGWPTHKTVPRRNGGGGYSSCHCALRKAAARSLRSAGLPQFCANSVICPKDFGLCLFSPYPRDPRPGKTRTRAQGQSPFPWHDLHRPHYPRKSPFTRLYCQSKNATILRDKGPA